MPKAVGVYKAANGTWYFKARTPVDPETGKRKQVTRRGFHTAAEARRARRQFLDDKSTRRRASAETPTVAELIDAYLAEAESMHRLAPKTLFDYRNYADSYIVPHLGHMKLVEVTPSVISTWQVTLSKFGSVKKGGPLAPGTIRLARATLNGATKYAIGNDLLDSNPLSSVPAPRQRKKIPAHWTPDEARSFLAALEGDRLLPLWSFMLCSGLRIGELVWLRWPSVDFEAMHIRVQDFATTLGYEVVESDGKSKDATRTIEIDAFLVEVLIDQQQVQESDRKSAHSYLSSDHVFTKPAGGSYHPQYISKLLAELSVEVDLPRLTAHGLRHTSATLMLANGVPPKVAAERLGHADTTLFMNLYSHVTPTMQREAAEWLGNALFGTHRTTKQ